MAAVAAAIVAGAWLTRSKPSSLPAAFVAARRPVAAEYIDDARCASCHPEVASAYAHSGMGRAFNTWKDAEPIEDRAEGPGPVLTLGDLNYQVVIDRGRMFQREFRVVDGVEIELNRREAVYVLGSGKKGRGYLASVNGYLTAMPLSWYTSRKAWDFSPGYRSHNARFGRQITHECMGCHEGPFGVLPGTTNGFVEPLPTGLGCQRCHGPGAAHVDFQESASAGTDPMPRIAKLEPRRQIDVCLQCHMLSDDAVRRGECSTFKPGDRLADCRVPYFDVAKESTFEAVGHGPRTMSSKCYKASGGKLTCTVCHDPHRPAHEIPRETYNHRCDECHQTVQCKRPLKANEKPRQGDCVACHMPTRKADDVPHASSTDHWIQVPGRAMGSPFPPPKNPSAKVVAFTNDATPLEDAVAEARVAARQGSPDERRAATVKLEDLLAKTPKASGEAWRELAAGLLETSQPSRVLETAARALAADSKSKTARDLYAFALGLNGDFAAKAEMLERVLRTEPWSDSGDAALLDALSRSRGEARAFELYEQYLQHHPPSVESLMLLGDMKRRVKTPSQEAAAFYEKAKSADGARVEPYVGLARLAMANGDYQAAAQHAHHATQRSPGDAAVWSLEAVAHAMSGKRDDARRCAEKALAIDANNAEASRVLRELEASGPRKRS